MPISKSKTIINVDNFERSEDSVRQVTNKFWTTDNNRVFPYFKKSDLSSDFSENVPVEIIIAKNAKWNASRPFYEIEQEVSFRATSTFLNAGEDPSTDWVTFVTNELFPGYSETSDIASSVFYDYAFDVKMPYDEREMKELSLVQNAYFADVKSVYNFYVEKYEKAMMETELVEQLMPNLYSIKLDSQVRRNSVKDHKVKLVKSDMYNLNTFMGEMPENYTNIFQERRDRPADTFFEQKTNNRKYFENILNFAKSAKEKDPKATDQMINKFSRIGLTADMVDQLSEFNDNSNLYMLPMYASIDFKTDGSSIFAEAFRESNLQTALMKHMMRADMAGSMDRVGVHESEEKIVQHLQTSSKKYEAKPRRAVLHKAKTRPLMDVLSWWANHQQGATSIDSQELKGAIILDETEHSLQATHPARKNLEQQISNMVFHNKFRKLVSGYTRDYEDILNGAKAYSETLMYKVQKFVGNPRGKPIQTYYLCNSENTDIVNFIDTQVKYDNVYTYVISAYQIVLGSQYYYKNVKYGVTLSNTGKELQEEQSDVDKYDYYATAVAVVRPCIKIMEVPIFAETQRIVDTPPVAPNVDIVPYRAVNNKLLFNLNTGFDDYNIMPPALNKDDQRMYDKIRVSQKLRQDEPIRFKSDDPSATFEIFRITKKPKSYMDFRGALRATVHTDISAETIQKASAAAYVERLKPNTKYYYMFRAIDVHGYLSNPTSVYEVELVDNAGNTFPIIKAIDFEPMVPFMHNKKMKKYLHIMPTILQSTLNEERTGLINEAGERSETAHIAGNNIFIGKAEEDVWNKKFKIRLTSRQTGRKIDLNVGFSYKHVADEEQYKNEAEIAQYLQKQQKNSQLIVDISELTSDALELYDA